jgi:hypothetical protein
MQLTHPRPEPASASRRLTQAALIGEPHWDDAPGWFGGRPALWGSGRPRSSSERATATHPLLQ